MPINLFIEQSGGTKEFNILTREWKEKLESYEFWKTFNRVVNGLQLQGPNIFKPYFLAANVFRRDGSVSVSLNISPRVCIISMHALENREKRKHGNGMISIQIQNSTKSVILNRISLRYLCEKKDSTGRKFCISNCQH